MPRPPRGVLKVGKKLNRETRTKAGRRTRGPLWVMLWGALLSALLCGARAAWPRHSGLTSTLISLTWPAQSWFRTPETPVLAATKVAATTVAATTVAATPPLDSPDAACARCHAAIYRSYQRTTMGRGSGAAMEGLIPGEFHSSASDVTYRVFARDGAAWMSFARAPGSVKGDLDGERQLLYFVGSATRGRTFLYRIGDQWFELPVNFYRRRDAWAMAPAYEEATTMPAPLPVDANCLHCHATQVEQALPEARNRFPRRPFDQGGIGCSACHGDPAQHLATHGKAPILNPDKLSVAARDSACIQCHLEGNAVVYRPGRSLAQFQPGEILSQYAVYFVRASQKDGGKRASSQYEGLLESACKRASGDKLTCTTCHDPHSEPAPAERVAFFRSRCLSCHTSPALATQHHPEQPDCAVCHMPRQDTADITHEQVTDHNIESRPAPDLSTRSVREGEELMPVGDVAAGDREFGLAYAQLAQKGDRVAGERALRLLTRAEQAGASDEQVHVNLGFLDQISGDLPAARIEYAAALREDPYSPTALANRAILDARTGDMGEGIRLLDRLVRADPSQTSAGLDLAFLECRLGQAPESRALAEQLRALNPDAVDLRRFLASGSLGDQSCQAEAASVR